MANNLYLLFNFNNYYNRKLIRYDTLNEYLNAVASGDYLNVPNVVNFTPNDGISTQQVLNMTTYPLDNRHPDYLLVVDDNNTIKQRWFVLESVRNRAGQYTYKLYRDTVAEAWNNIQDAPIFVERGILSEDDQMIFNSEGLTFNQIKQDQRYMKDRLECAWIVGYMSSGNVSPTVNEVPNSNVPISVYEDFEDFPYWDCCTKNPDYALRNGTTSLPKCYIKGQQTNGVSTWFNDHTQGSAPSTNSSTLRFFTDANLNDFARECRTNNGYNYDYITSAIYSDYNMMSSYEINELVAQNGAYIRIGDATYKINVVQETHDFSSSVAAASKPTVYSAFERVKNFVNRNEEYINNVSQANDSSYSFELLGNTYYVQLLRTTGAQSTITYNISSHRKRLSDQPYTMFAMPYGACRILNSGMDINTDYTKVSRFVAQNIAETYGGTNAALYDIQLVPYCPFQNKIHGNSSLNYNLDLNYIDPTSQKNDWIEGNTYDFIKLGTTKVGIIFWCEQSSYSDIELDNSGSLNIMSTGYGYKVDSQTMLCRLSSPNWAGQFDYNPAKNRDETFGDDHIYYDSEFVADITYKPYSPYINVHPVWRDDGLYGDDSYVDARGLICGGKFDLPQTSDAWASYERSNANYNNIFNRQIQSLEMKNDYSLVGDIAGAISGTVSGAATGTVIGGVAGGIAGGIAGAIGGVADVVMSSNLRQEAIDLEKDMHKYQLGNVQALPNSLTAVGALTADNTIYPVLELYYASAEEEQALVDYITYNGMTVGRKGTISEFSSNQWNDNTMNYFKGKLIRASIPNVDYKFVNTLKNEIATGLYIPYVAPTPEED